MALHRRHYPPATTPRRIRQFVGPGHKYVLISPWEDALFVWRRFIDDCIDARTGQRQVGVNCAVFRNEGDSLSSEMIREADALAWAKWPEERRHYTYVDPRRVKSRNPGYCFIRAGWRRCGVTKKGLLIFERLPD